MRILKGNPFNPGDKKRIEAEETLEDVRFNVFKFNNRPKPADKKQIIIITNFSEFGCETVAAMYCIPRVIKQYAGAYFIGVGWYGREYLYRHLVDEFWEIKEEHQWLREYSNAFAHQSKNLLRIERNLSVYGQVFSSSYFGHICLGNTCRVCKHFWGDYARPQKCPQCGNNSITYSLFADIPNYRSQAVNIPKPSESMLKEADKILSLSCSPTQSECKTVGVFARERTCYGRNLPSEFYSKLLDRLQEYGYKVIWLGEKQSTLPLPEKHADYVCDFTRMPESRNLELTLAIVSKLEFTVQFWTASTRLATMVGVPWILFESPDQIVGNGQEGMRIALTTPENKKKLVISHYLNVLNNHEQTLSLLERAIKEMQSDNWNDIVGLVEDLPLVESMLVKRKQWM